MNRVYDAYIPGEPRTQRVEHAQEDQARFPLQQRVIDSTGDVLVAPFEQGFPRGPLDRFPPPGEFGFP